MRYLVHKGFNETTSILKNALTIQFNLLCPKYDDVAFLVLFINSLDLRTKYAKLYARSCKNSYMFNYLFRSKFTGGDAFQYFVMTYNPLSTSDSFNKLVQDIELVSGQKDLITQNFLNVYQPLRILRDAYAKIGTFKVEPLMNYLHNLDINTAEIDGVRLSDSHYFSKGFTVIYLPCKRASFMGCMTLDDASIYVTYSSPLYGNGYDLAVYIIILYSLFFIK